MAFSLFASLLKAVDNRIHIVHHIDEVLLFSSELDVPFSHFLDGVVCRAGGYGHVGQGRILSGRGSHTGPVRDKYILTGVQLVPLIQEGGLRVLAHTYSSHFMDIDSRGLVLMGGFNICETSSGKHFGKLL